MWWETRLRKIWRGGDGGGGEFLAHSQHVAYRDGWVLEGHDGH